MGLVIAFAGGITILRQTHAIWEMDSANACTINSTLNTFSSIEPILLIVIAVALILMFSFTSRGFE